MATRKEYVHVRNPKTDEVFIIEKEHYKKARKHSEEPIMQLIPSMSGLSTGS